jgi:uncharacterized protein (DUF952 family)
MASEHVFHITTCRAWDSIDAATGYQPLSLSTEGFIHGSLREQVLSTGNRFYRDTSDDLVLLVIDAKALGSALRMEPAAPMTAGLEGVLFPHIYKPLLASDVVEVLPFCKGHSGDFIFPSSKLAL